MSKPNLRDVTLVCVDTTPRKHNGLRAMQRTLEQCDFGAVKFLTDDASLPFAVKIDPLVGMEAYSNFCIRDLYEYIDTSHLLIVQHDGYVISGQAWTDEFLQFDYIGAPFGGLDLVGNGGFSLRSRRLMEAAAYLPGKAHPEDAFLCRSHRKSIEAWGFKFAPAKLASRFAVEGASFVWQDHAWNSDGRKYENQFGFHSFLTPLPGISDRPRVFHHSGDLGDIIYSLATVKALGGGVLFVSPDNRFPFPGNTRVRLDHPTANLFTPFIELQDYIWQSKYTPNLPFSTDYDLNRFREFYAQPNPNNFETLYQLHAKPFGLPPLSETEPWLRVDEVRRIEGRPIVISRTPRYRNHHFPWRSLIQRYANSMVFVGLESEYSALKSEVNIRPLPPWVPTANLIELARIIAGAKCFIGNQSAPMALALGLGIPVIQECWQANPNCVLRRPNALYWGIDTTEQNLAVPEQWLNVP